MADGNQSLVASFELFYSLKKKLAVLDEHTSHHCVGILSLLFYGARNQFFSSYDAS